jgi:polyisoprenoid-binding protein YceI
MEHGAEQAGMTSLRTSVCAGLALIVAACATTASPNVETAGAGAYVLEKPHASLTWRVAHMGLSQYTARFADFDATLDFDPANVGASKLKAVVNPMSVRTDHPTDADWDARIGKDMFAAERFPQIVFTSTSVAQTGENRGTVTGDLSFMGVTKPVTLDVAFNGALKASPLYRGRDVIGFSAKGKIKRSEFGSTRYGAFVGDEVEILIEAEFSREK